MKSILVLASILFICTFIKPAISSDIILEQHNSLSCATSRAATSYFWKICQDGFYSKFLQSYETTCPGARRRREFNSRQLSKEDIKSKVFISLAKANNFLGNENTRTIDKREAEESSYPMWSGCCEEESGGCNNGDLLVHCSDELNYESGKSKVCEISREYYAVR